MKQKNEKQMVEISEEELKNVAGGVQYPKECKELSSFSAAGGCDAGYTLINNQCCK